jgi:hypothetical protein
MVGSAGFSQRIVTMSYGLYLAIDAKHVIGSSMSQESKNRGHHRIHAWISLAVGGGNRSSMMLAATDARGVDDARITLTTKRRGAGFALRQRSSSSIHRLHLLTNSKRSPPTTLSSKALHLHNTDTTMKFSLAFALATFAGSASAFTSPSIAKSNALKMADSIDPVPDSLEANSEPVTTPPTTQTKALPQMSESIPFMMRPPALDGSLVGDVGFDPLGFAKSKADLLNYREAEIKHARLAMLAAAGWPISELLDKKLALMAGLKPLVDANDRAPSLLNGGLSKVSPIYWVVCLVAAGAIDLVGISKRQANDPNYFAGNLGFDPLGLYPKDEAGQKRMQLAELKNGRLAMIAIFGFAIQEFVSKLGVVNETPIFFKPLGQALHEAANAGYYVPN